MAEAEDIEQAIRDYLPNIVHMSLGTTSDGRPWVCEVHFVYDETLNLYFRSKPSRRHSLEIAANPRVAGNIVTQHPLGQAAQGVYYEGTAESVEDEAAIRAVAPLFRDRLDIQDDIVAVASEDDGARLYKITVENYYIYGSLGDEPPRKHQLPWAAARR